MLKSLIKYQKFSLLLMLSAMALYASFAYDLVRSDFVKLLTLYAALFFISYKLVQLHKNQFKLLVTLAVLFRLVFLLAIPNLSQDFYRFIWDGRLLAQGLNPFLSTPEILMSNIAQGEEVIFQARELYSGMGSLNASHYTNYPPLSQLVYVLAGIVSGTSILGSIIVMRLVLIAADLGTLYFGKKILEQLKLPTYQIFWYILNPFILIELTGNLHFEGFMIFFLVASLYFLQQKKWIVASVLLGFSISVKLIPLMLLPLFFNYFIKQKVLGVRKLIGFCSLVLLTVLLTFLPFLSARFMENFSSSIALWFQKFEFNASVYYLIRWVGYQIVGWNIIGYVGKILPLLVMFFILYLNFFRRNSEGKILYRNMMFALTFYLLLSTTVHPWYLATPLILSIFTRLKYLLVWSFTVILSYSAYTAAGAEENLWLVAMEYLVVLGVFLKLDLKKVTSHNTESRMI